MAEADPQYRSAGHDALRIDSLPETKLSKRYLAEHKIVGFNAADSRSRAFNLMRTRLSKPFRAHAEFDRGHVRYAWRWKSFICANLALSLAKVASEGPVILVDLDLRRGSVAAELGLVATAFGVPDFLSGDVTPPGGRSSH